MARALASDQSPAVISLPPGVNQRNSDASAPARKRRRRNTGCALRKPTRRLVKSSSCASARDQSNQEISLSWQYALLLPCWVRPISSPPRSSGTPNDSIRVASIARDWRALSSRMAESAVGPSAPQFQDRLSLVPSLFASPLASLCLSL